jgi:hypothetical protein
MNHAGDDYQRRSAGFTCGLCFGNEVRLIVIAVLSFETKEQKDCKRKKMRRTLICLAEYY